MKDGLVGTRKIVREVILAHLGEGSAEEVTTDQIIHEASGRGAFDELQDTLEHIGKAKIVHEEAERFVDEDGRRVLVATRRKRELAESPQKSLLDDTLFFWKRASALDHGDETQFPRKRYENQVATMIRRVPSVVLPKQNAALIVDFTRLLFDLAEHGPVSAEDAESIMEFAKMILSGNRQVAVAAG